MKLFTSAVLIMFGVKTLIAERTLAALVLVALGLLGVLTYQPQEPRSDAPEPTPRATVPADGQEFARR